MLTHCFQACLIFTYASITNDILICNKTLLNNHYSEQDMTEETVLCLHLVVEVCADNSNGILCSVQKLIDHTTYI